MPGRPFRFLLLPLLLLCFATSWAQFTTVVVFGDSLSDTGNVAHVVQSMYGVRYPAFNALLGFDYTDGRFTDGTDTAPAASAYTGVWIEQLAASFTAKPAVKAALDGGTDYAYGDATTQDGTRQVTGSLGGVSITIPVRNMGGQIDDYLATNPTIAATTLFVFWGGSNDVYADSSATGVSAAVQREVALMQRIATAGGTNFLVMNLPPLGGFPGNSSSSNAATLNAAAASFDAQLPVALNAFQTGLAAQGKIVTVKQGDVLTPLATAAGSPMSVGLANATSSAQGISGNPDGYLIWDGLHPTTTGHHYAAAAAAATFGTLATGTVVLFTPATVPVSQTVNVTAYVTSTATAQPTGLVTFYSGTTPLTSVTLDATATASASVVASSGSLSAVYAGDVYTKPARSLGTTAPQATTTVVSSGNLSANLGAAITFTATVTAAATPAPAGTVTFLDGSTTLGTGTLVNGTASFMTATLTAGTHSITASYAGNGSNAASTSVAISQVVVAPAFTVAAAPASLTVARGSSGNATISATGVGGYSGTLTFSCANLPAHVSCTFSPATVIVSGTAATQSTTVTIATNAVAAMRAPALPWRSAPWSSARVLAALLGLPLLFAARRRRMPALLLVMLSVALLAAGGCSSSNSSSNNAATGTYAVQVVATPATGSAVMTNLQVTVQ